MTETIDMERRDLTYADMGLTPQNEIKMLRDGIKRMYIGQDRVAAWNRIHDLEATIKGA